MQNNDKFATSNAFVSSTLLQATALRNESASDFPTCSSSSHAPATAVEMDPRSDSLLLHVLFHCTSVCSTGLEALGAILNHAILVKALIIDKRKASAAPSQGVNFYLVCLWVWSLRVPFLAQQWAHSSALVHAAGLLLSCASPSCVGFRVFLLAACSRTLSIDRSFPHHPKRSFHFPPSTRQKYFQSP